MRKKHIEKSEVTLKIASKYGHGEIIYATGEDGRKRTLTVVEMQWYARIAVEADFTDVNRWINCATVEWR